MNITTSPPDFCSYTPSYTAWITVIKQSPLENWSKHQLCQNSLIKQSEKRSSSTKLPVQFSSWNLCQTVDEYNPHNSHFVWCTLRWWWWWRQQALIWPNSRMTSYSQQLGTEQQQEGGRKPSVSDEDCSHPVSSLLTGVFSNNWCHRCTRGGLRLFSYQTFSSWPGTLGYTHLVLLVDWRHSEEEDVSWRTPREDMSGKQ